MKTILLSLFLFCQLITAQTDHVIKVNIQTEFGIMVAELYPDKASITVKNFLEYVDSGYYSYGSFMRTVSDENQPNNEVKINVIQCDAHPWFTSAFDKIPHETTQITGIKHENGTLSMARYTPGTATSSFFICIGSQPELDYGGKRNPDGEGFAAFGKVIEGMDVMIKIHESENKDQALMPPIIINSISRIQK